MSCMVWRGGKHAGGLSDVAYMGGRHVGITRANEPLSHPVGASLAKLSGQQHIVARASSYVGLPHAIVGTDLIATTLTSYTRLCATMLPVTVMPVPVVTRNRSSVGCWKISAQWSRAEASADLQLDVSTLSYAVRARLVMRVEIKAHERGGYRSRPGRR